jgi:hypothetical protein
MVLNNNYEQIDSSYMNNNRDDNRDDNDIDVQFNNSEDNEFNNNYIDQNLFKGAHVVLVSEGNPWYLNKGIPKKYISNIEFVNDIESYSRGMNPHQIYKSDIKLDTTLPDLGLGHSILHRKITTDGNNYLDGVEGLSSSKSDIMNRNILLILLVILLIFWLYHNYKTKH